MAIDTSTDERRRARGEEERRDILVTSYTSFSTMIQYPLASSLCEATSAVVNVLDMVGRAERKGRSSPYIRISRR
jgi:hypothetical protein